MSEPGFTDIEAAAARIAPVAVRTPLLEYPALNERVGARVLVKPENLQRTGSFKFRGAYNRLAQVAVADRPAGVVAWSSGNHAQGVAAAARLLGMPATIVMPSDAPDIKRRNTLAFGAEIVEFDRLTESREDIGRTLASRRGAVLVPSYDDYDVMAGQGTAGLELAQQAAELGARLTSLLVCCGGGGLVAGVATAFAALSPGTRVHPVEPAAFDDHARSLASGERLSVVPGGSSICDALLAPEPGALTFPINQRLLAEGLTVTDDEVEVAMRFAFAELKLVVEPGGAVALAALLAGKAARQGDVIGIVVSGGNVDAALYAEVLSRG